MRGTLSKTDMIHEAAAPLASPMVVFEFLSLVFTVWFTVKEMRVGQQSWTFGHMKSQLHYAMFKQGLAHSTFPRTSTDTYLLRHHVFFDRFFFHNRDHCLSICE